MTAITHEERLLREIQKIPVGKPFLARALAKALNLTSGDVSQILRCAPGVRNCGTRAGPGGATTIWCREEVPV
jgi:hypothetical protein